MAVEISGSVRFSLNGRERHVAPDPERTLLTVLRDEIGATGPKPGCGEGACGACTVLVDGVPTLACSTPVGEVAGRAVTTVEGLGAEGRLHPVQEAFAEVGAMQCGYCTAGMVLRAAALLAADPAPDDAAIRAGMDQNICRCCTYPRILRAVRLASERMRDGVPRERPAAPGRRATTAPLPRPRAPWDLLAPDRRDWHEVLGDGLFCVLAGDPARQGGHHGGAWLHVGAGGAVTAFSGKADVGQGTRAALTLLAAEELRLAPERVRMVMGDTDLCPFDRGTFGSRSMPDAAPAVRSVASAARRALEEAAAERWGVGAADVVAADGGVRERNGARSLPYGDVVAGARRLVAAEREAATTPAVEWRTAGHHARDGQAVAAVTGTRGFPTDQALPGMLHGRVLRPPTVGATLRRADCARALAMPGVTVVAEGDFVAVAAAEPHTADRALQAIEAEWADGALPAEEELERHLRDHPAESRSWAGPSHHEAGDPDAALAEAAITVSATYTAAYIAHVPLETRSALAHWEDGRLTVWTASQRPFGVRAELSAALEVPEERIRVIVPPTGSGFGGRHPGPAAIEASRLARAADRPVRVRWSREEEFTRGYFRPAAVIDVRAGARADGTLTAWTFKNYNSGAAGIGCPYEIPNQRIDHQPCASPLPQGSYRALAATANSFARESHIDELAARSGADPLEFRLAHLRDPRLAAVLRAAAERAGWAARSREAGRGMGIACASEKGGFVATCASVRVHPDRRLEVLRLVTAFECGAIVNPDGLANQVEGATVMGLGGALFEAVHWEGGRIANASLLRYRVPRFTDVPPVEVVLCDRPDLPSAGGGETPIVAVAPAIAAAVFAATGRRLRSLPLAPDGIVPV